MRDSLPRLYAGELGLCAFAVRNDGSPTLSTPRPILGLCSRVDRLVRRDKAKLTTDRVAYFCHPDWMVDPGRGAPQALWKPEIDTGQGLAATAKWYREAGWL